MSSGLLPLRVSEGGWRGGRGIGDTGEEPLGNHQEGTSPLSQTPDDELTGAWPMTSIFPQTGHLVRFPACWSSALNFLPQEHDTEIIVTTSEKNQYAHTTLTERVEKWLEPDSRRLLQ